MAISPPRLPAPAGRKTLLLGYVLWAAAAAVAVLQVVGAFARPEHDRLADLHVYWGSVRVALDGGSLYDFSAGNGAPFTYPPFAGLVFLPLGPVSEDVLRVLWTVATLAVVIALAILARRADGLRTVPRALALPLGTVVLFASAPVSSNIRFGQISMFLVAMVLADCLDVVPVRFRGVMTGVAAAIKITPLIFLVYWWVSGQRRTALTAAGTFLGCTALAWLVLPGESARFWLTEIWNVDRVGNIVTGGNQSINGVLMRLEVGDPWRTVLAGALGGAVVVIAMIRAVRAHRAGEAFTAAVIVGAAGLAFSPVSWTHHQVWLVLACAAACGYAVRASLTWVALAAMIMILPVTSMGAGLPGGIVWGNVRLLFAIAVACVIPFVALRSGVPSSSSGGTSVAVEPNRPASLDRHDDDAQA